MPKSDKIMYAMISIGDLPIMLVDVFSEWGTLEPISLKDLPVTIHLYVEDVDSFINRVKDEGAKIVMSLENTF